MAKAFMYTLSMLLSLILAIGGLTTGLIDRPQLTAGIVLAVFGFALFGASVAAATWEPAPLYATHRRVSHK